MVTKRDKIYQVLTSSNPLSWSKIIDKFKPNLQSFNLAVATYIEPDVKGELLPAIKPLHSFRALCSSEIMKYKPKSGKGNPNYIYAELAKRFFTISNVKEDTEVQKLLREMSSFIDDNLDIPDNFSTMQLDSIVKLQGTTSMATHCTFWAAAITIVAAQALRFSSERNVEPVDAYTSVLVVLTLKDYREFTGEDLVRVWTQMAYFFWRYSHRLFGVVKFCNSIALPAPISRIVLAGDAAFFLLAFAGMCIYICTNKTVQTSLTTVQFPLFFFLTFYYASGDVLYHGFPQLHPMDTSTMESTLTSIVDSVNIPRDVVTYMTRLLPGIPEVVQQFAANLSITLFPPSVFQSVEQYKDLIQNTFMRYASGETEQKRLYWVRNTRAIELKYQQNILRKAKERIRVNLYSAEDKLFSDGSAMIGKNDTFTLDFEIKTGGGFDDELYNAGKLLTYLFNLDTLALLNLDIHSLGEILRTSDIVFKSNVGHNEKDLYNHILLFWYERLTKSTLPSDQQIHDFFSRNLRYMDLHIFPKTIEALLVQMLPITSGLNPELAIKLQYIRFLIEEKSTETLSKNLIDLHHTYWEGRDRTLVSFNMQPMKKFITENNVGWLDSEFTLSLDSIVKKFKHNMNRSAEQELILLAKSMQDPFDFSDCDVLATYQDITVPYGLDSVQDRFNIVKSMKASWLKRTFTVLYSPFEDAIKSLGVEKDEEKHFSTLDKLRDCSNIFKKFFFLFHERHVSNSVFLSLFQMSGENKILKELYSVNKSVFWTPLLCLILGQSSTIKKDILQYSEIMKSLDIPIQDARRFFSFVFNFLGHDEPYLYDTFFEFIGRF